ncbi:YhcH/YjgK/YiaL family protein [Formosa sp. PL04]|uniref:YhcH/YjgK/YiaL family protein n=1 Tax=Formosa sp. PL04 TaxID=3081755 RepID=UPI0029810236|nr:YhcH/YjgK/YiaL family protein [Formosa sp. PL04]MDW5290582.1 YhcH/YjgK/YiaL family protein [Formosa sp. PL04]
MIIDKIENQIIYKSLSKSIEKGFDFINKNDLTKIPLGKYEIEGEDIFAIVMEYDTKIKSECKFEGHHKYIDLQYMISGTEYVSLETLTNQIPVESNTEKDYDFYNIESQALKFDSGRFMIFFPDDLHQPGIHLNEVSTVKKVVIKIKAQ